MKNCFCILLIFAFGRSMYSQAHVVENIGSTVVYIDSLLGFGPTADQWPWDVEWGPGNSLWFTVKDKVCRYDTSTHQVFTLLNRADTTSNAMSIAFHPDFPNHPEVFITYDIGGYYYSYSAGPIVLYKYTYNAVNDELINETEILRWSHSGEHAGARLTTGSDGYIYCTTSEYSPSLDTAGNLNGRVLRVNPDGSIPSINSQGGYPISYGHRNPQGIVQVPNGNVFVSELGLHIDELNLIKDYKNYGWPAYDGDYCHGALDDSCNSPTFVYESPVDTAIRPPSGIAWYGSFAIPELNGCILQCILSYDGSEGGLVASSLNATMDDVVSDVHYFKGEFLRFRDVTVSPDGKIYVITNDRSIPVIRVIYNPNAHIGLEPYANTNLQLFPNPVSVWLNINGDKPVYNWQITSTEGKVIRSGFAGEKQASIHVEYLPAGMYFLRSPAGSLKFIKE